MTRSVSHFTDHFSRSKNYRIPNISPNQLGAALQRCFPVASVQTDVAHTLENFLTLLCLGGQTETGPSFVEVCTNWAQAAV